MYDQPEKVLRILTAEGSELPLRVQHAALYRLCAAHAAELRGLLPKPTWAERDRDGFRKMEALRAQSERDWRAELRRRLIQQVRGPISPNRRLVECGVVLRSLDRFHRKRTYLTRQEVELPDDLGGGRSVFLPPAFNPIAEAVPEKKKLSRRLDHQRPDIQAILGLHWRMVTLEDRGIEASFRELEPATAGWLQEGLAGKELKIGLASPFGDLAYRFWSEPDRPHAQMGVPYRFEALEPSSLRAARAEIDEILAACRHNEIDVLCLPELTLDEELLRHLQARLEAGDAPLRPALVVSGSFHLSAELRSVNRCHVLDGRGRLLFCQDKHQGFVLTPELAGGSPGLCADIGIGAAGGYEDIRAAQEVHIVDSPLGRFVAPICLDYCGDGELRELLIDSRVTLYLVPAMTPHMRAFRDRARELGTLARAATFVVNSAWLLTKTGRLEDARLYFGYLPERRRGDWQPAQTSCSTLRLFTMSVLLDGAE